MFFKQSRSKPSENKGKLVLEFLLVRKVVNRKQKLIFYN